MTVKELYRKYGKDYTILLYGMPLAKCKDRLPFTGIYDVGKALDTYEVIETRIEKRKHDTFSFSTNDLEFQEKRHLKGDVYAYVKKGSR